MILFVLIAEVITAYGQLNIVDSTSVLSQYGDGTRVLSGSSRDLLKQFQLDLDDLSARMGATTFGRAESIDQKLFRALRYEPAFKTLYFPDAVNPKCHSTLVNCRQQRLSRQLQSNQPPP